MTAEMSNTILYIYSKCYDKHTYVVQLKWIISNVVETWLTGNQWRPGFIYWLVLPPAGQRLVLHTFTAGISN